MNSKTRVSAQVGYLVVDDQPTVGVAEARSHVPEGRRWCKTGVDAGLSLWGWLLNRGIPLKGRDEWPLSWWWPLDTCLRGCRPPRRC